MKSEAEGLHAGVPPLLLKSDRVRILGLQSLLIAGLLLFWELSVIAGWADVFVHGRPSEMSAFPARGLLDGSLLYHTGVTLLEQVFGLVIGTTVGTAIGLGLWWSRFWSRVFEPSAVVLNATPKIVIAPLIVVWFGLGLEPKVMIAVLTSFVVAWLGAFEGVRRSDPGEADLVRSLGGSELDVFLKIVLRGAAPAILATLKMNVGLSLIGVITGEFLSSTARLGYLVDSTAKVYQMSHTLGAIVLIAVLAAV